MLCYASCDLEEEGLLWIEIVKQELVYGRFTAPLKGKGCASARKRCRRREMVGHLRRPKRRILERYMLSLIEAPLGGVCGGAFMAP